MTQPHRHVAVHLAAWLGMLVLAVLNGALREALPTPAFGDTAGRSVTPIAFASTTVDPPGVRVATMA